MEELKVSIEQVRFWVDSDPNALRQSRLRPHAGTWSKPWERGLEIMRYELTEDEWTAIKPARQLTTAGSKTISIASACP